MPYHTVVENDSRGGSYTLYGDGRELIPVRRAWFGLSARWVDATREDATHEMHMWLHPDDKYYKSYVHPI